MRTFEKLMDDNVRKSPMRSLFIYAMFLMLLPSLMIAANRATVCYISPVPGSKYLSPSTNIIIRTIGKLDRSMFDDPSFLSVSGSESGRHFGKLSLSDDGSAFFFVPQIPFTPGERVTVRTSNRLRTRESFVEPLNFQFEIGYSIPMSQLPMARPEFAPPEIGTGIEQNIFDDPSHWASSSQNGGVPNDCPVPIITQLENPASGSIFIGTYKTGKPGYHLQYVTYIKSEQQYLMILNDKGVPKYWKEVAAMNTDLKPQPNGHLTYYDFSVNYFLELDSSLNVIDSYRCGNGYSTNPHELRVLEDGHALLLSDDPQYVDMSKIVPGGSKNALVLGMLIQELDRQKQVVFQWRSFDHFSITDATHEDLTSESIDYVHPNAIELDSDGNILLSSRHLDEITKINRTTGEIIWRWGGTKNQFQFVNDTLHFSHQHSIRRTTTGTYILFDNGNYRESEFSRGVEYVLDQEKKTATMIWQYRHTPDIFSISMGSIQRLSNGNTFIGWGSECRAFTEVRPNGSVTLDAKFPDSIVSYRAFKYDWPPAASQTAVTNESPKPAIFTLEQNFPNPFNPTTTIGYSLAKASKITISVHDLLGRRIAILVSGIKPAGTYSIQFDGSGLPSGLYFYRMQAGDFFQTQKLLLLK